MAAHKMYFNTKTKYLLGLACLVFATTICAAFTFAGNDGFELARQEIMLRKIGHEVLLHAGDSTSRVLPVKKISDNEYQIAFENEFTFQPDSLVKIVTRSLANNKLAHNYVVNVLNCTDNGVIFGYAIYGNAKDDIVPCKGRKQPKSCYLIDLKFESTGITPVQKGYLIGGLPLLAFVGFLISGSVKTRKKPTPAPQTDHLIKIGNTLFDTEKRSLLFGDTATELTHKEYKLLLIFAKQPNEIIERARLQKEIWEDEGVIVGRSLDMFISKLRKKLESDESVELVNVHGKGYRLTPRPQHTGGGG